MIQIPIISFLLFWAVVLILPSVLGEQLLKDYGIHVSIFTISFEYTLATQRKMKSLSLILRSSCRGFVNISLMLGTAVMFLGYNKISIVLFYIAYLNFSILL